MNHIQVIKEQLAQYRSGVCLLIGFVQAEFAAVVPIEA